MTKVKVRKSSYLIFGDFLMYSELQIVCVKDKVHEFSRLNNKDLLDSTIDAVGETGLKVKKKS